MKLVIGGCSQGKLHAVLQKYKKENCVIFDGVIPTEKQLRDIIILNHFHRFMRERMQQNGKPEEEIIDFLDRNRDCKIIIISDEIGNGIVPTDAFEREYRERTGRILARLASRADEVVRILCGIEQRIK
jgi:adenosyl cobinamide kinase/adenosyl cobinamide phosphate guanylyltransferase